ncbi:hypothetical protein BK010_09055 [Tenericutes bacterium MO-XQ]|nr:hypothetical protein BK010_09055 [Tenericutes bacterium MO-XQ]
MKESKFTGSACGLFGWNLLIVLATYAFIIPVVFVLPKYVKWYYSHVTIDGEQLEFKFEGPWWGYLGWTLFVIATLGLGGPYAAKKMAQWEIQHTHIIGDTESNSDFDGSAWGILGYSLLSVLSIYALIFPFAWMYVILNRWYNNHTVISGKRLSLRHDGPWFGVLGWILFAFITLGIGSFYAQKKQIQWIYAHTHFTDLIE